MSKSQNPEVATAVAALLALPKAERDESLPIVHKLLKNLGNEPEKVKFRSVKLTNTRIRNAIAEVPAAKALMLACDFKEEGESLVAAEGAAEKAREALAFLEEASASYLLSVEYVGHAGAVRCVCALFDGSIVTGAMDNVVG